MRGLPLCFGALLSIACGQTQPTVVPLESTLRDSSGADVGSVTLRVAEAGIQLHVRVKGMSPGLHGMHLHEAAKCEAPAFQTAGAHLNPGARQHGRLNPQGAHLGDLGNLRVGDDRDGDTTVAVAGAEARRGVRMFVGLGQSGGLALVIHASRDDEATDPSGNSGARIACGELR